MPNNLDFSTWNFSNIQLAPLKLKLLSAGDAVVMGGDVAAEAATRAAADAVLSAVDATLQTQIDVNKQSYAHSLMLGGM